MGMGVFFTWGQAMIALENEITAIDTIAMATTALVRSNCLRRYFPASMTGARKPAATHMRKSGSRNSQARATGSGRWSSRSTAGKRTAASWSGIRTRETRQWKPMDKTSPARSQIPAPNSPAFQDCQTPTIVDGKSFRRK